MVLHCQDAQLTRLDQKQVDLAITTFTDFRLPGILGGHVNPGTENAAALCQQINARTVINTHDEPKRMQGLVARTARVTYPDYQSLSANTGFNFLEVPDYSPIEL